MRSLMLMSSSRKGTLGYLEHAGEQIEVILQGRVGRVLFIPYAGVTFSHEEYEGRVAPVFHRLGYELESIHRHADPKAALERAEALAVGGGNTFTLLKRLYERDLLDTVRARVAAGMPYIGWSAGTNVACPTIRTTNDMPIVEPPSLAAFGLVPFQINPHFVGGKPVGYNGESREERLAEFLAMNPSEEVVGLPEGTALRCEDDTATVMGELDALHFRQGGAILPLPAGARFGLDAIRAA